MKTKPLMVAILMSLSAACSHQADSSKLERSVSSYCEELESELHAAAEKHRQLAPAIDENRLSADQLERTNLELALTSVGTTPETRRARLRDFEARLRFCQRIREVGSASSTPFETRLGALHDALNEDIMSGAMPTAAKTATDLDQMTALAHEVNTLPFQR